jgi:hypothetical protein
MAFDFYWVLAVLVLVLLYVWWRRTREGLDNNATPNSQKINQQTIDIQTLADQLSKITVSQQTLDDLQTCVDNNVDSTTNVQNIVQQKQAQQEAYPPES